MALIDGYTGVRPLLRAAVEGALDAIDQQLKAAHPQLALNPDRFGAYLAERAPDLDALQTVVASDLYLACACVEGVPAALEQLEAHVARDLKAVLAKAPAQDRDDLLQAIRLKLYTGDPPGLAAYSGLGSLRGWVRVTASRVVLNALTRHQAPPLLDEEALLDQLSAQGDPELETIKTLLASDFKGAMQVAFQSLSPRERNLLRYAIGQGATVDQLAAVFHTHRSSAARWVAAARERFGAQLLAEIQRRTGASSASARQILDLVHSQLDLSWAKLGS